MAAPQQKKGGAKNAKKESKNEGHVRGGEM